MGYAHYTITRDGEDIEAGYSVDATCEQGDCGEEIDRGLYHLCGDTPGDEREHGCGHYFCGSHLYMATDGDWTGELCGKCIEKLPAQDEDDGEA